MSRTFSYHSRRRTSVRCAAGRSRTALPRCASVLSSTFSYHSRRRTSVRCAAGRSRTALPRCASVLSSTFSYHSRRRTSVRCAAGRSRTALPRWASVREQYVLVLLFRVARACVAPPDVLVPRFRVGRAYGEQYVLVTFSYYSSALLKRALRRRTFSYRSSALGERRVSSTFSYYSSALLERTSGRYVLVLLSALGPRFAQQYVVVAPRA